MAAAPKLTGENIYCELRLRGTQAAFRAVSAFFKKDPDFHTLKAARVVDYTLGIFVRGITFFVSTVSKGANAYTTVVLYL